MATSLSKCHTMCTTAITPDYASCALISCGPFGAAGKIS